MTYMYAKITVIRTIKIATLMYSIAAFELGSTAKMNDTMYESLRANMDWKLAFLQERNQFGQKFQVQTVVPHQTFFLS